jgi:hypothetical protein
MMRNRSPQQSFSFIAPMPSPAEKRKEGHRKYFARFHRHLFEFPAAFSENDKKSQAMVRQKLGEILHKGMDQMTFSEIYKKRDEVNAVFSASGFDAIYDIENRCIQVRHALGDMEF